MDSQAITSIDDGDAKAAEETEKKAFGIVICISSDVEDVLGNLSELALSLARTTKSSWSTWALRIFIVRDGNKKDLTQDKVENLFQQHFGSMVDWKSHDVDFGSKNKVFGLSQAITLAVNQEHVDFVTILRGNMRLRTEGWIPLIEKTLDDKIMCCSFLDESFRGFPSAPAFSKSSLVKLGKELFPDSVFANSEEQMSEDSPEALLFETFLRFGAAEIVPQARVTRRLAKRTQKDALLRSRFVSRHVKAMVDRLSQSLHKEPFKTMDIVVPSFRAPKDLLYRILNLSAPADCIVKFSLVCDNPDSKQALRVFQELEEENESNCRVRIRMNPVNVGPGGTRNHGLAESYADYVVFLDDDVLVEKTILHEYWQLAKQNPTAAGFIGRTILPPPQTPRQFAIKFAGIAYFWDIAHQTQRELPWGITANLCVRRHPDIFFYGNEVFTRGGGGEDVDFCMRLDKTYREEEDSSRSFVPAPKALVHHPYWNNGACFLKQYMGWSKGDSALIEIHPQHAFYSFPDFTESVISLSLALAIFTFLETVSVTVALTVLASYIFAEWVYETLCHLDLISQWGFRFTSLVGLETCIVRSCSEFGRFRGQYERGTIFTSVLQRFDWFQENWPEYKTVERTRALKRGAFRAVTAVMLGSAATQLAGTIFS